MAACRPLFVFGLARSGTNLVAGMLNAHRNVKLALDPLMPFFKALRTALLDRRADRALIERYPTQSAFQDGYFDPLGVELLDEILAGDLNIALARSKGESLAQDISVRAALESPSLAAALAGTRGDTFEKFLRDMLGRLQSLHGAALQWCGSKEVWTIEFIPTLARALPEARFIVIRRDPRSILASLIAMMRADPSQAAHTISYMRHWRKEAAVADHLVADPALNKRMLIIQYEDLARAPAESGRQICDFLDLPFDPSMLMPVAPDGAVSRGNSSFGAIDGVSPASIGRWRQTLDAATVRTIECHCGAEMLAEGYMPENPLPVLPDNVVARVVLEASREPGSWRSDSGNVERELANEARRWAMLRLPRSNLAETEVRTHFLFGSYFEKLQGLAAHSEIGAVAQA